MIKKAELYAQDASKVYTEEIVDINVCATANAIGYNLAIFQNIGGQTIIIFTQCIDKNTSNTLYLKYDYCPGFDSTNHYSAIVIKTNEVQQPTKPPASKPAYQTTTKQSNPTTTKPAYPTTSKQSNHHLQASLPNHLPATQHHPQPCHVKNFKKNHLKMQNL